MHARKLHTDLDSGSMSVVQLCCKDAAQQTLEYLAAICADQLTARTRTRPRVTRDTGRAVKAGDTRGRHCMRLKEAIAAFAKVNLEL
jgi:hypothetical protein